MAAKQQGKKKARDEKRKKIQKKHQLAKRRQKKMQPQKLKNRQAHSKRRAKHSKSKGSERITSPRCFSDKFLQQLLKMRMEAKARRLMKTLLTYVYAHVATKVETLRQKNELSNISGSDVQNTLKEAMTKELARHSGKPTITECA